MFRIILEPAFILHTRHYRETSLLLDILTLKHGRISVIAHAAKGNKSRFRGLLQLFMPVLINCSGKGELLTLGHVEPDEITYQFSGKALLSAFYLNELLLRLLHRYDAHPNIYLAYKEALKGFQLEGDKEVILRIFEKRLLADLGYGLQYNRTENGELILRNVYYILHHQRGLVRAGEFESTEGAYLGSSLLALHDGCFEAEVQKRDAKRLMRSMLLSLLGGKPLKTRELFI